MPRVTSADVTSADGTAIAFDRVGEGPLVVLVQGAFMDKSHPTLRSVATNLAPWFTVVNYDRRGRGASTDALHSPTSSGTSDSGSPDASGSPGSSASSGTSGSWGSSDSARREVEDLAAVITAVAGANGTAMVFGGSSGAALALRAASELSTITALALWEPPYHVDDRAPHLSDHFAADLRQLVAEGRPGDAVERFLVEAAEAPAEMVAAMRGQPEWTAMEAVAPTLAYEAEVMGPGNRLPAERLATVTQPTLVLSGDSSPVWMASAAEAVAAALPHATHRILEGQAHNATPEALTPELLEFFTTAPHPP